MLGSYVVDTLSVATLIFGYKCDIIFNKQLLNEVEHNIKDEVCAIHHAKTESNNCFYVFKTKKQRTIQMKHTKNFMPS